MEEYNLFDRIRTETDLTTAVPLLEICLRFLIAATPDDFAFILQQHATITEQFPDMIDPFKLIIEQIQQQADHRAYLLSETIQWAAERYESAEVVDIQPESWLVTIKVHDERKNVLVQQTWNLETEEAETMISE